MQSYKLVHLAALIKAGQRATMAQSARNFFLFSLIKTGTFSTGLRSYKFLSAPWVKLVDQLHEAERKKKHTHTCTTRWSCRSRWSYWKEEKRDAKSQLPSRAPIQQDVAYLSGWQSAVKAPVSILNRCHSTSFPFTLTCLPLCCSGSGSVSTWLRLQTNRMRWMGELDWGWVRRAGSGDGREVVRG